MFCTHAICAGTPTTPTAHARTLAPSNETASADGEESPAVAEAAAPNGIETFSPSSRPTAVVDDDAGLTSIADGTHPPLAARALRIMRAGPLNIPPEGVAGVFLDGACRQRRQHKDTGIKGDKSPRYGQEPGERQQRLAKHASWVCTNVYLPTGWIFVENDGKTRA